VRRTGEQGRALLLSVFGRAELLFKEVVLLLSVLILSIAAHRANYYSRIFILKTRKNAIVEYLDEMEICKQQSEIKMRHRPAVDRFKRYGRYSGKVEEFGLHALRLL